MPQTSSSSSKVYTERKWYCHYCGDGPLSCKFDDYCPVCAHGRCDYCQRVKMTYTTGR
ncbi:hypothetical protein C8A01DRAFT_37391 [Parachaetomium inaequale]|uniref:Uncharacterized protein n=1 Tax=Parachaetomium inaequale TaxID=2588326 RepID=A0AAN6PEW1_9PEZI|nr:hypothetical protein C8A01DRAFT_37391 [Parachaetomium inaequale]